MAGTAEIIDAFNTGSTSQGTELPDTMEATVARAVHAVVAALKENGTDITLDMRHGSLGCPRDVKQESYRVSLNGTISFEGTPIVFTAGYGQRERYIFLHMGGHVAERVELKFDYANPDGKWRAYNGEDLRTAFATALGRVHAANAYYEKLDVMEPATGERIEVSSPLKFRKPGA